MRFFGLKILILTASGLQIPTNISPTNINPTNINPTNINPTNNSPNTHSLNSYRKRQECKRMLNIDVSVKKYAEKFGGYPKLPYFCSVLLR